MTEESKNLLASIEKVHKHLEGLIFKNNLIFEKCPFLAMIGLIDNKKIPDNNQQLLGEVESES